MKLMTTIEKVQADGYEALRHDLEHDALAAHALLQALEWLSKGLGKVALRNDLIEKADELMREWMGQ